MIKKSLCSLAAVVAAAHVVAQDVEEPLDASVELGFISTSGNTETLSVQSQADVRHRTEHWQNQYNASVLFKKDEVTTADGTQTTEKTAERYFLSGKWGYQLEEEHSTVFLYGSHTYDEFGAYEQYSVLSTGYGSRLLDRNSMYLDVQIGPGYFRGEQVTPEGGTVVEKGAMLRGAVEYRWQVSDTTEFAQNLSVEAAAENTRTISETSLNTKVSDNLQMKVGYSVFYNSDVSATKESTDTTTFINLVYSL